jgi:hypothetical protein
VSAIASPAREVVTITTIVIVVAVFLVAATRIITTVVYGRGRRLGGGESGHEVRGGPNAEEAAHLLTLERL